MSLSHVYNAVLRDEFILKQFRITSFTSFSILLYLVDLDVLWKEDIGISEVPSGKQKTTGNFALDNNTHGRMDWAAK